MVDKVHCLKYEEGGHGTEIDTTLTEVDCQEDYLACCGLAINDSDNHLIHTSSNEIAFTDPVNGTVKISDLLADASAIRATRLGAKYIDGSTYAIDTDISLYQVPASNYVKDANITITNKNSVSANIRLAHVDGAIGSVANEDYIMYEAVILPSETKVIFIPGMIASDSILIRSDTTGVVFKIMGQQSTVVSAISRLAAYNLAAADTNATAYTSSSKITDIIFYICNKSSSASVAVRTALIDSNSLGDLADEDYNLYDEVLTSNESRGYSFGEGMAVNNIFMIRSSSTDVNIVIYGETYS
jgi:hypothetical protein